MTTRRRATSPGYRSCPSSARGPISSLAALAILAAGCKPEFDDRSSAVAGLRLLAVRSEPAEARPGGKVAYAALLVDDKGERSDAAMDWAFCSEPKPQGQLNDVSPTCFVLTADYLTPLGEGLAVKGALPANACRQFGPDVPEAKPGEPPGRPADPDTTGGYYQPVRLVLGTGDNQYVLGAAETRLTCGLPGSTSETLSAFKKQYRPNENPTLSGVTVVGGMPLSPDSAMATPLAVTPGQKITLRASWPDCPATSTCGDGICGPGEDVVGCAMDCKTPKGCGGPESFVYYDPGTRELSTQRESMVVSWFATAGTFDSDRTGQDQTSATLSADNTWTAPSAAANVFVWVVLRDSRGGVSWQRFRIKVG